MKRVTLMLTLLLAACSGTVSRPTVVMTLNIAGGFLDDDGKPPYRSPESRARQAALVAQYLPDVLSLQEVDLGCARSQWADVAAEVARRPGTVVTAEEGVDEGCPAGDALWVREGIVVERQQIEPLDYGHDTWPRFAIHAWLRIGDERIVVSATHLTTDAAMLRQEGEEAAAGQPDVVAGDMNEMPENVMPAWMQLAAGAGSKDQIWCAKKRACSGEAISALGGSDHPWAAIAWVN